MADQSSAGATRLLDGELDAQVAALVAVVEGGDGPGELRSFRVIGRVIVEPVVRQLFHSPSSARVGNVPPVMVLLRRH